MVFGCRARYVAILTGIHSVVGSIHVEIRCGPTVDGNRLRYSISPPKRLDHPEKNYKCGNILTHNLITPCKNDSNVAIQSTTSETNKLSRALDSTARDFSVPPRLRLPIGMINLSFGDFIMYFP